MISIILTTGELTTVDLEDYLELSKQTWHLSNGYAATTGYQYMHRLVNKTPKGLYTDHINGNKLDNRKENLRTVTKAQNKANTGKRKDGKSSKFKGVRRNTNSKTFMARIKVGGTVHYLGSFKTEIGAAKAYDKAATKYFKEFAKLNLKK